jgi:hypothetical protein
MKYSLYIIIQKDYIILVGWHERSRRKGSQVKRGHVKGTKRERKGSSEWYRAIEDANIRKIEAEWQAKQASK